MPCVALCPGPHCDVCRHSECGMQAEVGRLGKQREDLAREIRAAEREALSASDGLSTVQLELREASAELDLTRSRLTALQECATATMLQIVDSPQSYFHSMTCWPRNSTQL